MSSNPTSFRLPPNLEGKAEPEIVEAIGYHDDAITDLQQAIPSLKGQIDALKTTTTGTAATTQNITTAAENIVIQPETIGTVNNQTGNTAYATQQSDYGAFILLNDASAIAVTLTTDTSIQVPWFATVINYGAGTATLTPASGTISYPGNLSAASLPIPTGIGATIVYDGTVFWAVLFGAAAPSGLIQTIVLGAPAASVNFAAIPQTFTNLRLVGNFNAVSGQNLKANFNGDTTSGNYGYGFLYQYGGTAGAVQSTSANGMLIGGGLGSFTLDIPNYRLATAVPGIYVSGTFSQIVLGSYTLTGTAAGAWVGTDVTSMQLTDSIGGIFAAGSSFSLYGLP